MPIQTKKNKVDFYLLDYDGCLGYVPASEESKQPTYEISQEIRAYQNKEAKKKQGLKAYIDGNASEESTAVLGVGSNRQSLSTDVSNYQSKKRSEPFSSSAFHTMPELAKQWDMEFSKFLLEDIADSRGHKIGETLAGALEKKQAFYDDPKSRPPRIENVFVSGDGNKIALLYAHIHHMATLPENQGKEITVHFIDDREDILNALQSFYTDSRAKGLIPKNVTLQLGKYAPGEGVTSVQTSNYAPIKGEGLPNPLYADVVRSMGEKLDEVCSFGLERLSQKETSIFSDFLLFNKKNFLDKYTEEQLQKISPSFADDLQFRNTYSGPGMLGLHQQALVLSEIRKENSDNFEQLLAIRKVSRDNFEQLLELRKTKPFMFKAALYAGGLSLEGKIDKEDYQKFLSASKALDQSKPQTMKHYKEAGGNVCKQLVEFSPERTLITSLIMTVLATAFILSVLSFVADISILAKLGEHLVENTSFKTAEVALTTVSGAAVAAGGAAIVASPRAGLGKLSKDSIGVWNGGSSSFFYRSSEERAKLKGLVEKIEAPSSTEGASENVPGDSVVAVN